MLKRAIAMLSIIGLLSASVMTMAGCNTEEQDPYANRPKQLKIWMNGDDTSLQSGIADFVEAEENSDVNIKTVIPAVYNLENFKLEVAAGQQPDMVMLDHVYITALGREGTLVDLNTLGAADLKDKYLESCWNGVSFKGKTYGLPHNGNTIALMYNQEMLDATGMEAPKNYEELLAVGKVMRANNDEKWAFTAPFFAGEEQGRLNWAAFEYFFWLWRCGGDILNEDYTQATFNGEEGVKALNMLKALVTEKICNGEDYLETQFYDGDVGMIEMGNWSLPRFIAEDRRTDFGVAMLPTLVDGVPAYSGLGLFAYGITTKCAYKEEAYKFLAQYTTDIEYQLKFGKQNNQLPVSKEALDDPFYKDDPNWQVYIEQYALSRSRPGVVCWDTIESTIALAVRNAVNGGQVQEILDAAANKVNIELAKEPKD